MPVSALGAGHVERVRHDDSVEAETAAQHAAEHRRRERRRPVGVDRGDDDVRGHDARDARGDGRPEGLELAHLEQVRGGVHPRQREVRVGHGVAVPREVLRARCHSLRLQAFHGRDRVPGHVRCVGTEAAHPDDGVVGRRVDVDDGSEVEVDAQGRELARDGHRRLPRHRGVVEPAENRVARLVRPGRVVQPCHVTALLVDRHEQVGRSSPKIGTEARELLRASHVGAVEADGRQPTGILPDDPRGNGGAPEAGHQRADDKTPKLLPGGVHVSPSLSRRRGWMRP